MGVRVAILAMMILVGGSANVSALTADDLLAKCEQLERTWVIQGDEISVRSSGDHQSTIDAGFCLGYLEAYFDIAYVQFENLDNPNAEPVRPLRACPPKSVSLVEFIRMFLQTARNNPADLHQPASFFIILILLNKNFPCAR